MEESTVSTRCNGKDMVTRHGDPTWLDEKDLNCGALLQEFEHNQVNKRFEVMQSHEKSVDE